MQEYPVRFRTADGFGELSVRALDDHQAIDTASRVLNHASITLRLHAQVSGILEREIQLSDGWHDLVGGEAYARRANPRLEQKAGDILYNAKKLERLNRSST